jgi:CBS domain-containing protein
VSEKVRDIMAEIPVSLPPIATVTEAAQVMRDYSIGDVLVVEGDRLHGVVTDRDIVVRALAEQWKPDTTPLRDICSTDLAMVGPEDDSDQAVRLMRERAVRRLPVVESARVVGVVTIGNLAVVKDPDSALADISAAPPNE